MREGYPEFLRNPCKVGRQWLPGRLVVRPVVHDTPNTLFGHEPQVMFEQLATNIDLGLQLQRSYL